MAEISRDNDWKHYLKVSDIFDINFESFCCHFCNTLKIIKARKWNFKLLLYALLAKTIKQLVMENSARWI